jgi:hypothetical protein
MKTLTLIAAGIFMTVSGMEAASIQLLHRSRPDNTGQTINQAPVQSTPPKKETLEAPRPMLGLPRNG